MHIKFPMHIDKIIIYLDINIINMYVGYLRAKYRACWATYQGNVSCLLGAISGQRLNCPYHVDSWLPRLDGNSYASAMWADISLLFSVRWTVLDISV